MHFYQKNIGDFNNATRHLTRVERSLFSDAIELYYDTELPLSSDINKLNRLLLAHSQEEKDALLVVLNEFFTLTDEGYFNKRCNEEILKYQGYMESKSRAGKASAEQRAKQKATGVQQVFNTEPTKHNQEPLTNNNINTSVSNKVANCPYDQIILNFNNALSMLPAVKQLTDKRKKVILARWKEDEKRQSLEWWESFFGYVSKSDFLTGRSGNWSACCFDWIFKSENFVKIIEGNYENKP
jgi:uncharacterized protein YdaU (DUF1376 family)